MTAPTRPRALIVQPRLDDDPKRAFEGLELADLIGALHETHTVSVERFGETGRPLNARDIAVLRGHGKGGQVRWDGSLRSVDDLPDPFWERLAETGQVVCCICEGALQFAPDLSKRLPEADVWCSASTFNLSGMYYDNQEGVLAALFPGTTLCLRGGEPVPEGRLLSEEKVMSHMERLLLERGGTGLVGLLLGLEQLDALDGAAVWGLLQRSEHTILAPDLLAELSLLAYLHGAPHEALVCSLEAGAAIENWPLLLAGEFKDQFDRGEPKGLDRLIALAELAGEPAVWDSAFTHLPGLEYRMAAALHGHPDPLKGIPLSPDFHLARAILHLMGCAAYPQDRDRAIEALRLATSDAPDPTDLVEGHPLFQQFAELEPELAEELLKMADSLEEKSPEERVDPDLFRTRARSSSLDPPAGQTPPP